MKKYLIIIQILLFSVSGIYGQVKTDTEGIIKGVDDFYKKTRFIMTKMEKNIYKHLPDDTERAKFIKEFWEKRDPTPDNFENEAKMAYAERIAYANRWFSEGKGKKTGWDSERGRILLQLGIPDRREFGELDRRTQGGPLITTKRLPMERWFYYRFQLFLIFTDTNGFGNFKLANIPAQLLTAIDLAKLSVLDLSKSELKHQLTFKPSVKNGNIILKIPVKRISFEEKDGKMRASFGINIYAYKNYLRIDEIKVKRTLDNIDDSILKKKYITLNVPIKFSEKGKYNFDIILEDKVGQSKYRDVVKYKIR
ncbi:MAG: GWxTD domain-containing protein [Acidobacteriota bacterium]